jgi:hypothetical protein
MSVILGILLALVAAGGLVLGYALCVIAGESDKAQDAILRKIKENK